MSGQQGYFQPNYSYNGYPSSNYGMQRQYMPPMGQQTQPIVQNQPSMGQMPMQQMVNGQSPIQGVYFTNETEAKAFIVMQPNTSLLFIDKEQGKAFLKSTDNMCASTTRYFNLIETDEGGNSLRQKPTEVVPQIDMSQFASKEQLKEFATIEQCKKLAESYAVLEEQMRIIQKQLNGGVKANVGTGNK